ncbi:MlaD family protein [Frankia sp. CiP1_Cm_nod2]|uniref:MlaD family protein n=1 Tax=Frankia sp. CiP1_Cm_nod2 TaxID=2897161 RepID=UPI0020255F11
MTNPRRTSPRRRNLAPSRSRSRGPLPRLVGVALVTLLATAATTTGLVANGSPSSWVVHARFNDASPLLTGNEVKLKGVKVGRIAGMRVDPDGHADVTMELDPAAMPLHTDARLTVRPLSLLGERFLELDQGSPAAPALPRGGVIPATQTGRNTDLDEVLNTIDEPTGESLAALVTVLGEGLQGNGGNIDDAVRALAPAMRDTGSLAKVLDEQNTLLNNLVDNVEPVADALARDGGRTLDDLVGSTQRLLGTTAARQQVLERTLAELPDTLASARATLAELTSTATAAVPTLQAIRPTTDNLTRISAELDRFAATADPALASLDPVLAKAQSLLDEARPVVSTLRPSGPDTVAAASSLKPLVGELSDNIVNVFNFIKYWALATNGSDGLSHYFRGMVVVTPDILTGLVPGLGSNLGVGGSPLPLTKNPSGQPLDPAVTGPQQPGGGPAGGTGGVTGILSGLLAPAPTADGGVTGLNQQQESGMLGFLLGGS